MLYRDRPFHRRTAILMDEEARLSHAAWARSMYACDQVHSEGISLRTTVMAQQSEITELQAADRRRQSMISDLLKADYQRQRQLVEALKIVKSLKTQMIELQRQQGPAKDPAEPELPEEANSITDPTTTTSVTSAQLLQAMINEGVTAVLAARAMTRSGYNSNGPGPRPAQTARRECSYSEFLKCKPLDFKGTEGVVGLTRWFEKMESVFSISNCTAASQVRQKGKESMMIFPRTIKTNRIRGKTQARPTLQAIVTGNHTPGLSLYVPSVIAIMKQVLVHLGVVTAIGLAIWPGTVGYGLQITTTITTTTTTVTTTTTTTVTTTTIINRAMVALSVELKAT
ncbi:hypothetical protein Tco_1138057, partial [Tanacetum coccineum]